MPILGGRFARGERERREKREEGKGKTGIGEGKEGQKGREGEGGKGEGGGKGRGEEFASLALGGIDAPGDVSIFFVGGHSVSGGQEFKTLSDGTFPCVVLTS